MNVLVVDDSAYQRLTLSAALREIPRVTAVDTAASGEEAIRRVVSGRYDLVTLDIEMPGMDGFAVLRWLMVNRPLPVLVVSDRRHDRTALLALELGAFHVMGKASARAGGLAAWKPSLAEAVEEAAQLRLDLLSQRARRQDPLTASGRFRVPRREARVLESADPAGLVIAASTGGPPALRDLFSAIAVRPVIVGLVQHIPAPFTRSLAQRLTGATGWEAREAQEGMEARPGVIQVAPGDRHLVLEQQGSRIVTRLLPHGPERRWCPSADLLFFSAAELFGARATAVVLTGMGDDGAEGARAIAAAGGVVLCESRESAVVSGMPDAAARAVPGAVREPLATLATTVAERLSRL